MKLRTLSLAALVAIGSITLVAQAGERAYKWVDEKGVVHFGGQPPADARSEAIKIGDGYTAPDSSEPVELTPAEKQAAQDAEACRVATENFRMLAGDGEVQKRNEYGETTVMTAEQKAADRDRARQAMDRYCKPAGADAEGEAGDPQDDSGEPAAEPAE